MKKITVLGNFSGRNAGDNAILGNLMDDISEKYSGVKYLIPTFNAGFVKRHFSHHNIEAMNLMPWNGAFKIFGWPTYKAMTNCDVVLITDNILFDRSYFNPLFNYLSTIALFSSVCKKRGIPIIPYNASLGPYTTDRGRAAMQRILDAAPFLSLRDEMSRETLDKNKLKYPKVIIGADCAINTVIPTDEHLNKIIAKESLFTNPNGTISFNINAYIDTWLKLVEGGEGITRESFVKLIAGTIDNIIQVLNVDIMYTTTQIMDYKIVNETMQYVKNKNRVKVIGNANYNYKEITGLLSKCGLHVGMRTHSKILAAAAFTPMVTINAYPKSVGFVRTLGMEKWIINFKDLSVQRITEIVSEAWKQRAELRAQLIPRVRIEQQKAKQAVDLLNDYLV
ncbi:MAG: polysaccharide pyruvyl transferase family protein [Ignavibacteriaceae bacterium]|nr:polysaccharide pyruvyl transferase family protein [Ignavibacteriaceae bacterium]